MSDKVPILCPDTISDIFYLDRWRAYQALFRQEWSHSHYCLVNWAESSMTVPKMQQFGGMIVPGWTSATAVLHQRPLGSHFHLLSVFFSVSLLLFPTLSLLTSPFWELRFFSYFRRKMLTHFQNFQSKYLLLFWSTVFQWQTSSKYLNSIWSQISILLFHS